MSDWPNRIYLQRESADDPYPGPGNDVTWCQDRVHDADVAYVRVTLSWADRLKAATAAIAKLRNSTAQWIDHLALAQTALEAADVFRLEATPEEILDKVQLFDEDLSCRPGFAAVECLWCKRAGLGKSERTIFSGDIGGHDKQTGKPICRSCAEAAAEELQAEEAATAEKQ